MGNFEIQDLHARPTNTGSYYKITFSDVLVSSYNQSEQLSSSVVSASPKI